MKNLNILKTFEQYDGNDFINSKKLQKVKAVSDDSGHWYIIPNDLEESFNNELNDEDFVDSGKFSVKYGKYMTRGSLNNIQLYAEIK
jgi:hypothetical protein